MRVLSSFVLIIFYVTTFSQNIVRINFFNIEPDSVKLVYQTNFYAQSLKEEIVRGRNSTLNFSIPVNFLQVATLIFDTDTLYIWLENKPIEISITKNYLSTNVQFNNSNASVVNNFLKNFPSLSNFRIVQNKILDGTIDQFEMFLFEEKQKQENFLNENKNKLDEVCYQHLRKKVEFNYWLSIFAYPIIRANQNAKELTVTAIPSILLEGFPEEDLKNKDHLVIPEFCNLLKFFITYKALSSNGFRKFTDFSISLNRKLSISRQILSGEVYAYNYGQLLLEFYPFISKLEQKQLLKNFSEIPFAIDYYKFCNDYIKKNPRGDKENFHKSPTNDEPILFEGLDGKKHALSEFKGKVVYIDFWASWCGPCRAMFPYSKELYKSLTEKEKKEIVFLFINIDADVQAWKKAILENGLEGVHWHSPGNWNSEAVRYFKINSIPRYMIVNKKGEIVDFNAKRPADPALKEQLKNLIKE